MIVLLFGESTERKKRKTAYEDSSCDWNIMLVSDRLIASLKRKKKTQHIIFV